MKKKIILLFIVILSVIAILNFRNRDKLKPGKYEALGGKSFITLEKGNKFVFNILKDLSYKPQGTYRLKDNELTLFCDNDEKYVFTIKNNCLIYQGVKNAQGALSPVFLGNIDPSVIYMLEDKKGNMEFAKIDLDIVRKLSKKGINLFGRILRPLKASRSAADCTL